MVREVTEAVWRSLMSLALFAKAGSQLPGNPLVWVVVIFALLLAIFAVVIFFSFIRLWIQSLLTGAKISILDLVGMKLRNVDYGMIVRQKIALVQAGIKVNTEDLEAHYLARIDLAGRDVLKAVGTSVNPMVIDCPDPTKGRNTLDGVCHNGIQLKAKARVTVRTKLDRLVGGATEETIIARVGEGIVKAIGSAKDHKEVLANPNMISQAVLNNSLDSQTAFEIVSVDIVEIDVGENIGANLQAAQAAADLRVAQAAAEQRRAAAVALEQEMRAKIEENRAKVVEAEAQVPMAISHAFREGKLGVMDYYNLRNLQADTDMRSSIAGPAGKVGDRTDRTGA